MQVHSFLSPGIVTRAASALLGFLDLLVGPRCTRLAVEKPEQYHFDRDALMQAVAGLVLRLGAHAPFIAAVHADPDYDEGVRATMGRSAMCYESACHAAWP